MVAYVDRGGKIVACLPVMLSRKYRIFVRGNMPGWSHINGPVIHPSLSGEEKAQAVSLLLNQLGRWISYRFVCEPADCDPALVETFRTAGFRSRNESTYLRMPCDPDVLGTLHKKHRNSIKRAACSFHVTEDVSAKEFIDYYLANLTAGGKNCYADPKLAQDLIEAGQTKSQIKKDVEASGVIVFAAKTKNCETVAAIACLLNKSYMYYWLTTRRRLGEDGLPIKGSDDAIKMLLVHASQRAAELNLIFDADGVFTSSVSTLYKRFFPRRAERYVFMRRAPHDPWEVKHGVKMFYKSLEVLIRGLPKKLIEGRPGLAAGMVSRRGRTRDPLGSS